jgi:hypothetical protein
VQISEVFWSFAVDINLKKAMQNQLILHHHLMGCTTCLGETESEIDITLCRCCCLAIVQELTQQLHPVVLGHPFLLNSLAYIQAFFPENRVTALINEGIVQHVAANGYFQLSISLQQSSLTRWIQLVERVPGGLSQHSDYISDMKKSAKVPQFPCCNGEPWHSPAFTKLGCTK